ncbi:glycosyltransferase family 1 protein [Paenibacillus dendritiformis]|uniref:CgeB family protein n=1 Tax=Paenibacillus dendritiformis TaxID=130049 RepID=UPI00143D0FEC|nr:glycosyltransferase [Paenibacillus dendritiformis]NKI20692.1 glycosyltransferase family 1 protein [Paenibacillus dendritiformis]NRF98098.1 glycosyltransferase family 1 protein [Paenibacillus dendritiformis]
MSKQPQRILMCYGKTPYTPGSYLERAFGNIGVEVDVITDAADFSAVDTQKYAAVLFVESPTRPRVAIKHRERIQVPVLFWIHHGENRLAGNLEMCDMYRPDILLMSHSLHLASRFQVPIRFFPFGVDPHLFHSAIPYAKRAIDVSFVGTQGHHLYKNRNESLRFIEENLQGKAKLSLRKNIFLEDLSKHYGNSKIVFNQTADTIKSFNMRLFEGMGCGALILTDDTPEQSALFENGVHYVLYDSKKDMLEKLQYYLSHPDEATKIAAEGQRHVVRNHTYEHRARQVLDLIKALRGWTSRN